MATIVAIRKLIFLWSWTPRTTPRSSATHAPGSGLISTDALSPKKENFIKKYARHFKVLNNLQIKIGECQKIGFKLSVFEKKRRYSEIR